MSQTSLDAFARSRSDLSPMQRQVLEAVESGKDPKEIALATDLKATTVRTHLYRARKKLGTNPGWEPI